METAIQQYDQSKQKKIERITSMILSPSSVTKAACKNLNDFDQQNLPSLYYSLFSKEIDMEKVNTIPQIFEQKTPSMVVIAREIGNEKIIAMIELYIIALDQFLNFNKSMTQMSIHETAELIYRTYFQLTITDVLYVFKNASQRTSGTSA